MNPPPPKPGPAEVGGNAADQIPDLPENAQAREFLKAAPSKGLWMPLGQQVKVMQCWRCKANGHKNGGYGHRTGDRECPYFLSGNIASEELRKSIEDPMAAHLQSRKQQQQQAGTDTGDGAVFGSSEEIMDVLQQIKQLEKLKKEKKKRKKDGKKSKKAKKKKAKHKKRKAAKSSDSSDSDESESQAGAGSESNVLSSAVVAETAVLSGGAEPGDPVVIIETERHGRLACRIFLSRQPSTASSFLDLCARKFYDGLHFHRVIDGFMVQFGCPFSRDPASTKAGTGAPDPGTTFIVRQNNRNARQLKDVVARDTTAGTIADEHIWRRSNTIGTLAMANTGAKNTGGSQFFINLADNAFLDWFDKSAGPAAHVVFGELLSRADLATARAIGQLPTDDNDVPLRPVKVVRCREKGPSDRSRSRSPNTRGRRSPSSKDREKILERDRSKGTSGRSRSRSPNRGGRRSRSPSGRGHRNRSRSPNNRDRHRSRSRERQRRSRSRGREAQHGSGSDYRDRDRHRQ
eukprot:SAG31_NODE_1335_length_8749_cov_3.813426_5_plen_518_part_00